MFLLSYTLSCVCLAPYRVEHDIASQKLAHDACVSEDWQKLLHYGANTFESCPVDDYSPTALSDTWRSYSLLTLYCLRDKKRRSLRVNAPKDLPSASYLTISPPFTKPSEFERLLPPDAADTE